MKALYITSTEGFSGKTAVCLALGRRLQREGYRVGYFKPLSTQPWEPTPGRALDEDADFVRRKLGLEESPEELVGVVLSEPAGRPIADFSDCRVMESPGSPGTHSTRPPLPAGADRLTSPVRFEQSND